MEAIQQHVTEYKSIVNTTLSTYTASLSSHGRRLGQGKRESAAEVLAAPRLTCSLIGP